MINKNVLIGLDSHLFLFDGGQRSFAFSVGDLKPSLIDISNFAKNIIQRNEFLCASGIPFFHIIFPSKEVVLNEKVIDPWRGRIRSLFLSHYLIGQPILENLTLYPLERLLDSNK